jgi:hypothetical protein
MIHLALKYQSNGVWFTDDNLAGLSFETTDKMIDFLQKKALSEGFKLTPSQALLNMFHTVGSQRHQWGRTPLRLMTIAHFMWLSVYKQNKSRCLPLLAMNSNIHASVIH